MTAFHGGERRAGELLHEAGERRCACSSLSRVGIPYSASSARATSTRSALPARSPIPFTVPCTQVAPGLDGGDRRRGREAEVVVAVPVDGDLVIEPLDDLADEERGRLRASRSRACRRRRPPAAPASTALS